MPLILLEGASHFQRCSTVVPAVQLHYRRQYGDHCACSSSPNRRGASAGVLQPAGSG